jgi:hypothetical protein
MIEWNIVLTKPAVNTADKFDAEHGISEKVLVRIIDNNGKFWGYSFGRFYYNSEHWVIEGYLGDFIVTHWSSLNEPKSLDRYVVFEYNENASASYRGTRFMTPWCKPLEKKVDSHCDIIAENISEEEAYQIISEAKKDGIDAFYENLPDELKSDETKNFLKNLK